MLLKVNYYDDAQVNELATIPSREVLIAKLLGSFKAPLSNLAYLLNAIKEKRKTRSLIVIRKLDM